MHPYREEKKRSKKHKVRSDGGGGGGARIVQADQKWKRTNEQTKKEWQGLSHENCSQKNSFFSYLL